MRRHRTIASRGGRVAARLATVALLVLLAVALGPRSAGRPAAADAATTKSGFIIGIVTLTLPAYMNNLERPITLGWGSSSAPGVGFLVQNGVLVASDPDLSPPASAQGATAVASADTVGIALKGDKVIEWDEFGLRTSPPATQSGVTAISAGHSHLMALANGVVIDWAGPVGLSTIPAAAQSGVSAIAAGGDHALALKNGGVIAWGSNASGQTNVPVAAQSGVVAIAAGFDHSVALKSDGTVVAWGADGFGQSTVPDGLTGVTQIAVGNNHNLALKSDGTIVTWGRDNWSQRQIPPLTNVLGIFAGGNTSLVLVPNSTPTITASAKNADNSTYTAGTWTNQTVTVHFTCADPDGPGILDCPADTVISAEGETASVSGSTVTYVGDDASTSFGPIRIDKTAPTVTLTTTAPNPTNTSPIPVTAQFNEAVTGFVAADIVAGNATVSDFVAVDGDTYTFNLVPSSQGTVTADLPAGRAVDRANNGNTVATQVSRTYDSVPPTVTLTSGAANPTNTSPIAVTAQFSESVSGFIAADIVAGNATVSNFVAVDGDTYTFNLVPSGQGTVTADIAANKAQDSAGNGNTAATQFARVYDSVAPTVTLTSGTPNPTNTSPIPVTVQFSEAVSGFIAADLVTGNATVGNFVAVDGDTYTFDLVPSGQGTVTADLPAGRAADSATNGNVAATQFARTYDSVAPGVTVSQAAGQADPTTVAPVLFTALFTEPVSGLTGQDVSFAGSTAGGTLVATVSGGPTSYTIGVSGMATGGTVVVRLGAGAAQDDAHNPSLASAGGDNNVAFTFATQLDNVAGALTYGDPTATLTARLRIRDNGTALASKRVSFTLDGQQVCGVAGKPACPTTDADGVATLPGVPLAVRNAGTYRNVVCAEFAGDDFYLPTGPTCGPLVVARRILTIKATDRTVGLGQPNPLATPPANCLASATATSACWLQLANGSTFVYGQSWSALNLANLRFTYSRNYPSSNASETVGKTYKISVTGILSTNYDVRYQQGTLTVVP